jgi:hypothetical protein
MRHIRKGGARITDSPYVWLFTGRDGLIWRLRVFDDLPTALEHLGRDGPSLGL